MIRGKDFTLAVYEDLIRCIKKSGYSVITLKEYFRQQSDKQAFLILRHDVDRRPENALKMAFLESSLGIYSTYYFRVQRKTFHKEIIQRIDELGHEIGYHYEVMDKAHGDSELARQIFVSELAELRTLADVSTVCMHGNPFSRWDNRDFWRYFSVLKFDLLGEAYISVHDPELHYATDTGRGWNRTAYNLKDSFSGNSVRPMPSLSGTCDLIDLISSKTLQKIYLQVHPNRWHWQWLGWYRQLGEDLSVNCAKALAAYCYKRK